ncbi:MAG: BlaI/MecI/CopY family transcriptional regulator [Bacteroidia bacterium]
MIYLTRAEEQIMKVLWKLENAFIKDIVDRLPKPKPAYNTVSTVVRILEKKKIVSYEAFGKTHRYFPLISKEQYTKQQSSGLLKNYFDGSVHKIVSHFSANKLIDLKELDATIKLLNSLKKKK